VSPADRRATAIPEGKATVQRIDIGAAHRVGIDSDAALLERCGGSRFRPRTVLRERQLEGEESTQDRSFKSQAANLPARHAAPRLTACVNGYA